MKSGKSKLSGLILLIIIVAIAMVVRSIIPTLASALKWIIVIGILLIIVFFIALISSALKTGGKGPEMGVDTKVKQSKKAALSPADSEKLKAANQEILKARLSLGKIKDKDIRDLVDPALENSEKILKTLKEQPDEIRKAGQFLNYYLPTLNVVLDKYMTVEASDIDLAPTKEKVTAYLSDISKATTKEYENLFSDEVLDLSVEMEAMQLAFKRDGLLTEAEIPQDAAKNIDLTL